MANLNIAACSDTEDKDACSWSKLRQEAAAHAAKEPALSSLLHATILEQDSLGGALVNHLSEKLATAEFSSLKLRRVLSDALTDDTVIVDSAARDLLAVMDRDPAARSYLQVFLYVCACAQFYQILSHHLIFEKYFTYPRSVMTRARNKRKSTKTLGFHQFWPFWGK